MVVLDCYLQQKLCSIYKFAVLSYILDYQQNNEGYYSPDQLNFSLKEYKMSIRIGTSVLNPVGRCSEGRLATTYGLLKLTGSPKNLGVDPFPDLISPLVAILDL